LLHADSTALRKVRELAVIGYGAEIKFLAQQMYLKGMPIKHGVLIANYLLRTAIEHVQGCGGESRIATLSDGITQMRHFFDVWEEKGIFNLLRQHYRAVLLSIPDEEITDEQFDNCLGWFAEEAWKARTEKLRAREFNVEMKQAQAEWNVKRPWSFEGRYYSPPPDTFDILDRRQKMPKYKRSSLSRFSSLKQLAAQKSEDQQ
jgi:hypothetical protein